MRLKAKGIFDSSLREQSVEEKHTIFPKCGQITYCSTLYLNILIQIHTIHTAILPQNLFFVMHMQTSLGVCYILIPLFHWMVRLSSTRLYSLETVLFFGFPPAKVVDNTWYCFWYHLGKGSKRAESILKGVKETLQITDWSERIVTCGTQDILNL